MTDGIFVKNYAAPQFSRNEILRYSGIRQETPDMTEIVEECIKEAADKAVYRVCYSEIPIQVKNDEVDFGFAKVVSSDLSKNLHLCDSAVIFAATAGIELDRLTAKYSRISPAKALIFQGIGAERIECLCDLFNNEISCLKEKEGKFTRPRFSPGYGDLLLEFQKDIFKFLDCPVKIGLTLNDSLLMSPTKSVTAIIGIGKNKCITVDINKCGKCSLNDCEYRRNK